MNSPSGDSSGSESSNRNSSDGESSNGNGPEDDSGENSPSSGGPGGPPVGPDGEFGGLKPGGDGASRVTLSEAAEATEQVLEGCRRELQLLRRWLRGEGADMGQDAGQGSAKQEGGDKEAPRLGPGETALQVARRLEACAGALRNASAPRDS
jgi:hypothetical protein